MAERKYASWSTVVSIIDNIKSKFSPQGHKHTSSDITDLKIPTKVSELTNDAGYVPNTRTVNGKALSSNITLAKSDVGLGNVDNTADSAKSVKYATSAGSATTATSATSATKATQDASGNVITTTYETKANATTKYDELTEAIGGKSDTGHTHTIANVTNLQSSLDAKVPTTRTVNGKALSSNISLTASDVGAATTANVNTAVSNHNTSTSAHSDIRGLISDLSTKLNNFLDIDDTTTDQLSEVIELINNNKGTLESLTTSKVNVSDIVDNLTTSSASKVLSAKQGVAIKALIDALDSELDSHGHDIADISGLQSALDGKAASSHGTHVSYSTTAPVMDGTASAGSASTVARSDHKHPTDTTRASKTEFDTHASDTTKHITSTERTNWGTAYTHSQAAHAPSNAEVNQNAFSNIAVSGQTTVAADAKQDTVTFAGSNVTITTDATNDKVTFAVADGTTSAKGVVKLTNSTSSTSTTTAATPSSVKSAYDLANTAKTNAATAQSRADSAYTLAEGKVDSLSDLGITATATELNYVDGVTSAIQTQLDNKAAKSHSHDYLPLAGGNMTGHVYLTGAKENSSTSNTSQIIFGTSTNNHVAVSSNINAIVINPDVNSTTNQIVLYLDKASLFPSGIQANITGNLSGTASKATSDASGNNIKNTYETKSDASAKLTEAKAYTDAEIAALINGAPTTLDTLDEIAAALEDNADIVDVLENAIGTKANASDLTSHTGNKSNPHGVTKSQVGLGNVPNVATNDQTPTYTAATTLATLVSGEKLSVSMGKIMKAITDLISHIGNKSNPHGVTLSQLSVTATAAELNKLDGVTATTTELNYVDGVTSNIQTQLDSKVGTSALDSYMTKANPTGTGALSINRKADTSVGTYSVAEGKDNTATGYAAHAEGTGTTASADSTHAEGYQTTASAWYAHAEGNSTTASNRAAHAEGGYTVASGQQSHAEGFQTIAASTSQHVQGKYNIEDANDTYAHIVGNGSSSARSNAHTLDWDGNAWFAGTIKVGGTSYADASEIALVSTTSLSIPTTGWAEDSASGFYRLAITNSSVTANSIVNVNLGITSLAVAEDCGLKGVTESYAGGFYVYAESAPTSALTGTLVIQN